MVDAEYSYRLIHRTRRVYGGDLFASVGLLGVGTLRGAAPALPLAVTFNVGLRLDTEIGVFELSLGNGLGRVPL